MKNNNLVIKSDGASLVVRISGDVDHHSAKGIRERIDKEIFLSKPHLLLLDFTGVGFMDSSGIALIIGRAQSVMAVGGSLRIVGMSESMRKLVRLSGLEKIRNVTVAWEEV